MVAFLQPATLPNFLRDHNLATAGHGSSHIVSIAYLRSRVSIQHRAESALEGFGPSTARLAETQRRLGRESEGLPRVWAYGLTSQLASHGGRMAIAASQVTIKNGSIYTSTPVKPPLQ